MHFKSFKLRKNYWFFLLIGVIAFGASAVSFFTQSSYGAEETYAEITSFDITPNNEAGLGETDATYTLKLKFQGADFSGGVGTYMQFTLVTNGNGYYDLDEALGNLDHFKLTQGTEATGDDVDITKGDFTKLLSPVTGLLSYRISDITDTITAGEEVEIKISGVTSPDMRGVYGFNLYANDSVNEYFSIDITQGEYNSYEFLGDPCVKVKVMDPDDENAVKSAQTYVRTSDWRNNAYMATDYNGVAGFYPNNFNQYTDVNTCPTGTFYVEAMPDEDDRSTYAESVPLVVVLPDEASKYFNDPINLSAIQLSGHLLDGAIGGDAIVTGAEIMAHPMDFASDPGRTKTSISNASGDFYIGGLTQGAYVLEFQMPWDDSNSSGITVPNSIEGIVIDADGKVTVPENQTSENTCSDSSSCDLGNITYPEANKTVLGTIKDEDGNPVTSGEVEAMKDMGMGHKRATIEPDGTYSFVMGGGSWFMMPRQQINQDTSSFWTYCGMPKFINFAEADTVEETKTVNFTVKKANYRIYGTIVDSDGNPFTDGQVEIRSKDGCGGWDNLDESGSFDVRVPAGTYSLMVQNWSNDKSLGSPQAQTVTVNSTSSPYNVGEISMIKRRDVISGRVWSDENDNGQYDSGEGRSAVRVEGFKMSRKFDEFAGPGMGGPGGGGFNEAETDANGAYSLYVSPGMWMVNVMLDPAMMGGYSDAANYIYTGSPEQVNVTTSTNGQTYSDRNFEVQLADATINGALVDEDGNGVTGIYGYAFADSGVGPMMGIGMGAPISNSTFTIKVPAGTYDVGVDFPPDTSGYTSAGMKSATLTSGETKTVTVTVKPNNKRIKINLVDEDGNAVTNLSMMDLFAESSTGAHVFKMLYDDDLSSGSTTLNVCEGTWEIGYFVNPGDNNYMSEPLSKDSKITVTSAHTADNPAVKNIVLREANSTVSGKITDPSGNALSGAWISTDNRKASNFDMGGPMFMMGETSDDNGNYSITMPEGTYKVQAFLPPSMGYINPEGREVTIGPDNPATVNLQFGQSDATITGTVTLDGSAKGGFITAYSENGGYNETTTSDGDYTLNVTKDATWYVRATYESGEDFYRSPLQKVVMGGATNKSQDLAMAKASFTVPSSVSATFDYQNAKQISLSNGFVLSIPAGAIAPSSNASGNNITVTVSPTAQLSAQNKAIPVGIGYDITAIDDSGATLTSTFNTPVTITIPYTDDYLSDILGSVDEDLLDNAYWDDSTSAWRGITGATIDTENNTISFTVSHFTTFSILSGSDPTTSGGGDAVSEGASEGTTSSGDVSKPMAPKDTGSIVESHDNRVFLMIPSGAVMWDADFEFNKLQTGFEKPTAPLWIVGSPYDIKMKSWWNGAEFSVFNQPITMIVRYDPTALGLIPENSLRLNYYDTTYERWRPVNSVLIKDRHEVAAVVDHIHGRYALVGGFGYQGQPSYIDQTVTVESDSSEVGLTEEVVPKKEITEEVKHPTATKMVEKPEAVTAPVKKKSFFGRLIDAVVGVFK